MPEWRALPGTAVRALPAAARAHARGARSRMRRAARPRVDRGRVERVAARSTATSCASRSRRCSTSAFPAGSDALARFARHAARGRRAARQAIARDDGVPATRRRCRWRRCATMRPSAGRTRCARSSRRNALADAQRGAARRDGAPALRARATMRACASSTAASRWCAIAARCASTAASAARSPGASPGRASAEVALGGGRGAVRFARGRRARASRERYTHDAGWHFGARDGGERIRLDADASHAHAEEPAAGARRSRSGNAQRLPLLFHGERAGLGARASASRPATGAPRASRARPGVAFAGPGRWRCPTPAVLE